ncbi:hypothetical protein KFE94_17390 [bacterium SCSIO 12643]|nr:hypothetical protein KFE94_17390 [bacterium SCSIO 12643]
MKNQVAIAALALSMLGVSCQKDEMSNLQQTSSASTMNKTILVFDDANDLRKGLDQAYLLLENDQKALDQIAQKMNLSNLDLTQSESYKTVLQYNSESLEYLKNRTKEGVLAHFTSALDIYNEAIRLTDKNQQQAMVEKYSTILGMEESGLVVCKIGNPALAAISNSNGQYQIAENIESAIPVSRSNRILYSVKQHVYYSPGFKFLVATHLYYEYSGSGIIGQSYHTYVWANNTWVAYPTSETTFNSTCWWYGSGSANYLSGTRYNANNVSHSVSYPGVGANTWFGLDSNYKIVLNGFTRYGNFNGVTSTINHIPI